jgi:hypothetical protein
VQQPGVEIQIGIAGHQQRRYLCAHFPKRCVIHRLAAARCI